MRLVTWLCVLVVVLTLAVTAMNQDSGYVLISWGNTSLEMSLVLAVLIAVVWVWLVARLVSLELWLRRATPALSTRVSRKKAADARVPAPDNRKNWTPKAR